MTTFIWAAAVWSGIRVLSALVVLANGKFPLKYGAGDVALWAAVRLGVIVWALMLLL